MFKTEFMFAAYGDCAMQGVFTDELNARDIADLFEDGEVMEIPVNPVFEKAAYVYWCDDEGVVKDSHTYGALKLLEECPEVSYWPRQKTTFRVIARLGTLPTEIKGLIDGYKQTDEYRKDTAERSTNRVRTKASLGGV